MGKHIITIYRGRVFGMPHFPFYAPLRQCRCLFFMLCKAFACRL